MKPSRISAPSPKLQKISAHENYGVYSSIFEEFHRKTRYIHFGQFEIFEI